MRLLALVLVLFLSGCADNQLTPEEKERRKDEREYKRVENWIKYDEYVRLCEMAGGVVITENPQGSRRQQLHRGSAPTRYACSSKEDVFKNIGLQSY